MSSLECHRCYQTKPELEFSSCSSTTRGFSYWCKDCERSRREEVRQERGLPPQKRRGKLYRNRYVSPYPTHSNEYRIDLHLYNNYGITLIQKSQMIAAQNSRCAICNELFDLENNSLLVHVDHCHTTGKVRGILCHGCNTGLGGFKDNIFTMNKAIEYVKRIGEGGNIEATLSPGG